MTEARNATFTVGAPDVGHRREIVEEALAVYRMDPGLALHRAAEALLLRRMALPGPVLDLGCHDGGFSWLALRSASKQADLIGSDRDLTSLGDCMARGVHRAVLGLDASRLPFGDGVFGSVVCNSVLAHVDDPRQVLHEIARVLYPGGVLAATVPTPAFREMLAPVSALRALGFSAAARRVAATYDRKWHQLHFLGEADWRLLMKDAGLSMDPWTEYLGGRGSLQWSSLFMLTRTGIGRITLGALLRRLFPRRAARTRWLEQRLAAWLAPALVPGCRGSSALLVARRSRP